jgi:endo-1,4-beta-D-glucanase Y
MLVESKDGEKTNETNTDITNMIKNFLIAASGKGLAPDFVHVDKCFSEITAAKVFFDNIRVVIYTRAKKHFIVLKSRFVLGFDLALHPLLRINLFFAGL